MTRAFKSLKNLHFNGIFWTKYIMTELKKFRGVTFHESEEWCKIWRKTNLWFEKWRKEFGKFLPEHSNVSKLGLWWDPFIKIRKCMSFKFIEKLCIMTKKNDANFEEEFACCFEIDTQFDEFWPEHLNVSKICTLLGSFWPKCIMF